MIVTLLVFLLILSILVLIHEFGHYYVAKKLGIKVEEFGYGFPPRVWGKKIGETLYSINLLPIGGFVKLFGEDEAGGGRVDVSDPSEKIKGKDKKRAFFARPVGQRAAVVLAGVIMNTLLAVVIYYAFLGLSGFKTELPLLNNHDFKGVNDTVRSDVYISSVEKGSPAEKSGIPEFVKVTKVNNESIDSATEFSQIVKSANGREITIVMVSPETQQTITKKVTPRVNPAKNQGAVGVGLFESKTAVLNYESPLQKIFSGFIHPYNLMSYNFDLMAQLIKVSVQNKNAAPLGEGVAGPVGIYSLVGTIVDIPDVKERILQILNLAGILSISLAVFNVLPIPALDGGRLFFILIEAVTRKKVNPKFEALAHTIGMAVLLTLIVLVTFKDIFQFIIK